MFLPVHRRNRSTKFNLAPSVSIQSPEEGSYFDERTEIVFEAMISDNADDPEFLTITWSSDLQGELGGVGVIDDAGYLIFQRVLCSI